MQKKVLTHQFVANRVAMLVKQLTPLENKSNQVLDLNLGQDRAGQKGRRSHGSSSDILLVFIPDRINHTIGQRGTSAFYRAHLRSSSYEYVRSLGRILNCRCYRTCILGAIMKRMTNKVVRKLKNNIVTNIRLGEYKSHHDDWCY